MKIRIEANGPMPHDIKLTLIRPGEEDIDITHLARSVTWKGERGQANSAVVEICAVALERVEAECQVVIRQAIQEGAES